MYNFSAGVQQKIKFVVHHITQQPTCGKPACSFSAEISFALELQLLL